jgi:putative SOS response-associated peptidase YedK
VNGRANKAGQKQPIFISPPDGSPFAFAGLWEFWDNKGKEETLHRSCTILTRDASESVKHIHNRMPVILKADAYDSWLSPDNQDPDSLQATIENLIYTDLKAVPVSKRVNSVKNNSAENTQPIEPAQEFQ